MPSKTTTRTLLVAIALCVIVGACVVGSVWVAEQQALSAEEEYVTERLQNASCLADWGVNEGAGPRRAAEITDFTGTAVRVSVTVPYAHTVETEDGPLFADSASKATYVVTITSVRRVEGDEISPC